MGPEETFCRLVGCFLVVAMSGLGRLMHPVCGHFGVCVGVVVVVGVRGVVVC